jgi:hypothetical protein
MKNLACRQPTVEIVGETNEQILSELTKAGITPVAHPKLVEQTEVPTNYTGVVGMTMFKRAWYYWCVTCEVPLHVAELIYADPNCRKDVRVAGHCGAPPPSEWAVKIDNQSGKTLTDDKEFEKGLVLFQDMPKALEDWTTNFMPEGGSTGYRSVIQSYHIDTQEGLNRFVEILKANA